MKAERLTHVAGLDGVRGLAIALVVACHALAIAPGFIGVEVFFVLSGFLITTLLLDEQRESGGIALRGFYGRRVRRLYPALAFTLLAWLGLAAAGLTPWSLAHELLGVGVSGTYIANIASAWFYHLPAGLRHLWTLALEEQFYLLWPPILALSLRRGATPRRLAVRLAVAAAAIIALRTGLTFAGARPVTLYESPITASSGLLLGAVAAFLRYTWPAPSVWSRWLPAAAFASLTFIVVLGFGAGPGADDLNYFSWLMVPIDLASALLVLHVVLFPISFVAWLMSFGWLRWLGRISYSLYLIHPIILVELVIDRVVLTPNEAIVLSLLIAAAMERFIERPFRRRRRARVQAAPALEPVHG